MSEISSSQGQIGMYRGEWLRLVAQILALPEAAIRHLYRQAIREGVIFSGARGKSSRPLDVRERKDFLAFVSMSLCAGSASAVAEKSALAGVFVRWSEDGLTAIKGAGVRVTVSVSKAHLEVLLAADLS